MREDGKRNFLGIVMGGCGRYVCFTLLFLGRDGMGRDGDGGMFWFRDGMEWNGMMMFDVGCGMYNEC